MISGSGGAGVVTNVPSKLCACVCLLVRALDL